MKCECGSENIRIRTDSDNFSIDFICRDCGEYVAQDDLLPDLAKLGLLDDLPDTIDKDYLVWKRKNH